jgi:hypothetical protein
VPWAAVSGLGLAGHPLVVVELQPGIALAGAIALFAGVGAAPSVGDTLVGLIEPVVPVAVCAIAGSANTAATIAAAVIPMNRMSLFLLLVHVLG